MTGLEVYSVVTWDSQRPLEIEIIFTGADGDVRWVFARDLIADALDHGSAGDGDIHVSTDGTHLSLELFQPPHAVFRTASFPLRGFMSSTYAIVPRGHEELDVDEIIANLLEGTS
jgi:hypothetical protein